MGLALLLATVPYVLLEAVLAVLAVRTVRDGDYVATAALALFAVFVPLVLMVQILESGRVALGELRARPPKDTECAELEPLIARVAAQADLPPPVLRMIGSRTPNALAIASAQTFTRSRSGRRLRVGNTIVVTTELVRKLDTAETEAVVAHELAHLANRDAAVLTFVAGPAVFARSIWARDPVRASFLLVFIWPVCLLSLLLTRTVSRYREYTADRGAALVTGAPEALISALHKLTGAAPPQADLRGGAAARALWIVSPSRPRLPFLSEHPPVERRVERLERLASELRGR